MKPLKRTPPFGDSPEDSSDNPRMSRKKTARFLLGIGVGIAVGIALNNFAIGAGVGLVFGWGALSIKEPSKK